MRVHPRFAACPVSLFRMLFLTCVMAGRCAATVCPTPLLLAAVVPVAVRGSHDCCGVGALMDAGSRGVGKDVRLGSVMHCTAMRCDAVRRDWEKFENFEPLRDCEAAAAAGERADTAEAEAQPACA